MILNEGKDACPTLIVKDRRLFNTLSYPNIMDLPPNISGLVTLKCMVFLNSFLPGEINKQLLLEAV